MSGFLRTGLCEPAHSLAENLDLLGFAVPGSGISSDRALRFKREPHVLCAKEGVHLLQKRQYPSKSTICVGLIQHLLDRYGRQTRLIGHRQHHFEGIQSLATNKRRENGE